MLDLIFGLDEVDEVAVQVLEWVKHERGQKTIPRSGPFAISLSGPMGSGKTTLIRAMGEHLGCNPLPTSPTFSLIQTYMTPKRGQVVHADLFRLRNAQEWLALDLENLAAGAVWLWVEWPEKAMDFMPEGMAHFELEACTDSTPSATLTHQRRLRFLGWAP
ncbi:MAG: tRNA (adenosine(37)-N6)-threonylcarbamoyltransferase complex ATPase subunit type 1 TsaE [Sphingomonadales bacterium]|nr:tRNA (adenosine(37)-N6)-threonylcarbamoyltransferase complex ATPase subunit type 1 TsaE [Sphingomonadales bacterium]MBM3923658.1 tRNA (adenosine(37)-N6)-threonylcarbamoyltransferase complex ATPase subunit type 1 TsaE [Sphingomonadales bacterium]MBM3931898.1 tRNA (adenosine(37)-N6)-threonylcarbamoyltransferase complex ATPase subunit type 1 TsaE [Sphingomonadales bacterium]